MTAPDRITDRVGRLGSNPSDALNKLGEIPGPPCEYILPAMFRYKTQIASGRAFSQLTRWELCHFMMLIISAKSSTVKDSCCSFRAEHDRSRLLTTYCRQPSGEWV